MGCSNPAGNIEIVPLKVSYGQYECSTVTATADVASSHNNDYFRLYNANDVTSFYVWMNVGGAGVDPAPGGTGIAVAFAVNATASTVAAAISAAIDAFTGGHFSSSNVAGSADVCICNMQPGPSTDVASGVGLTGFVYAVDTQGSYTNLGFCDGDIEQQFEVASLEVKAHQTGNAILTNIIQSTTFKLDLALLESTSAQFKLLFSQVGTVGTPTGGTLEVVGVGSASNGRNLINLAGKLVLHPYNLVDADESGDYAVWLASLIPSSIVHSGDNPKIVNVSFTGYYDDTRQTGYNQFVKGPHTQAGNFKA